MAQLFAGTSGWAYPSWKPDFYPQKLTQKQFLNFYATQLNAVEVNFTFRQLVKESTLQNWLAETPAEFRFTLKVHQELLATFLTALPRRLQAAFEFRHDSWFVDETYASLRQQNAALCVAETEEGITPDVVTADFAYYRFRKPTYTAEERQAMVARIQQHLAGNRDVFAYFKHEETPEGALYARELLNGFRP